MKLRELLRSDFGYYIRPLFIKSECEICKDTESLHLHHNKHFSIMLNLCLTDLNMQEKEIEDYNDNELKIIRNYMLAEQIKCQYTTLCDRCHKNIHKNKILLPKLPSRKYSSEFKDYLDENGSFFILNISNIIDKKYIFRFVYLISNADKDGYVLLNDSITSTRKTKVVDGKRVETKSRYCKKGDLKYIYDNFTEKPLREIITYFYEQKMIVEDEYGYIKIPKKYFMKNGYMCKGEKLRIFNENIISLYNGLNVKSHVKLDSLFKLSKLIGIGDNLFHDEMDNSNILTIPKVKKYLGYTRAMDFKHTIFDLTINNEEIIKTASINGKDMVIVNPKLYSKINKLDEMKRAEIYFK